MIDYLTMADVLAIHDDQIETYGGTGGVRDLGALEAALFRPQSGYYENIIAQAAALWESLSQNHPFLDGNKRTAFAATYTFLAINGYGLNSDDLSAQAFILPLYKKGNFSFENVEPWLRENTKKSE